MKVEGQWLKRKGQDPHTLSLLLSPRWLPKHLPEASTNRVREPASSSVVQMGMLRFLGGEWLAEDLFWWETRNIYKEERKQATSACPLISLLVGVNPRLPSE